MILATSLAALLLAQQSSQAVVAEYPDEPETWALEYPSLIGAFVQDYYGCLKGGNYVVGDGRGFAEQYKLDIPRCDKNGIELQRLANERLADRQKGGETTPEDVSRIFETVRRIHVARGADLDKMVGIGLASSTRNRASEQAAPVDAPCIARIAELKDLRQSFAATQGPRIEKIYDKEEYTRDDQLAILTYTTELSRMTMMMQMEMRACPNSSIAASVAADEVPDS